MRSRNIKPGFFENEDISDVPIGARLLFIGLWCLADRDGRLEDRPKRIQGQLFRWDGKDINADKIGTWLEALATKALITRYMVESTPYIQIKNFHKHQHPHRNEAVSTIPKPLATKDRSTRSMVASARADSLNDDCLNDDSLNLDATGSPKDGEPCASAPTCVGLAPPVAPEAAGNGNGASTEEAGGDPTPDHVAQLWNDMAHPNLPRVATLTDTRRKHVRARLVEHPEKSFWLDLLKRINASPLLTGQKHSTGDHSKWVASFDWVMNPTNMVKILEGNYDWRR